MPATEATRVLVGGVGQLYQGDLDLGRVAAERLATEPLGAGVAVEDLSYGAVAVAQRLQELTPDVLVLVGAMPRGRAPGVVERRPLGGDRAAAADVHLAVSQAITGYVDLDLLVGVAAGLGALPPRTVVVDVEPARCGPHDELSPTAARGLEVALGVVRAEVAAATRAQPARRPSSTNVSAGGG